MNKAICFIKMAAKMAADGGQGEKFTINRLKTAFVVGQYLNAFILLSENKVVGQPRICKDW